MFPHLGIRRILIYAALLLEEALDLRRAEEADGRWRGAGGGALRRKGALARYAGSEMGVDRSQRLRVLYLCIRHGFVHKFREFDIAYHFTQHYSPNSTSRLCKSARRRGRRGSVHLLVISNFTYADHSLSHLRCGKGTAHTDHGERRAPQSFARQYHEFMILLLIPQR